MHVCVCSRRFIDFTFRDSVRAFAFAIDFQVRSVELYITGAIRKLFFEGITASFVPAAGPMWQKTDVGHSYA